ncbi:hypothetical protein CKAH01_08183 [Colletotrichum kahawae]|uniref:Uncharacterized protein n=1 Tax=Colletotrichum kahawae TaxID=34407 RepID=A0AAD9Y551_COLKA|nr:hypothetical protein CKAH01_08183 [Colletotrichum kahawae]
MVIQNIGPSTSETSLLFTRRPLLALLLAISSPWPRNPDDTIFTTTGDPTIPIEIFAENLSWSEPMVLLVEYAMALGAAANKTDETGNGNDGNEAGLQLKEREGRLLILLSVLTTPADARNCLIRYVCSAIVGRTLLSFELAYLTRSVKTRNPRKSWASPIRTKS